MVVLLIDTIVLLLFCMVNVIVAEAINFSTIAISSLASSVIPSRTVPNAVAWYCAESSSL